MEFEKCIYFVIYLYVFKLVCTRLRLLFLNYLLKSIVSLHKIPFYSVFGIVSDFTVLFKFKTKHWLIMTTIIFVSFQPNNNVTLCLTPDGNYTIQVSTTDVNYTRLFKNGSISTG